jgi:hypothetical protein
VKLNDSEAVFLAKYDASGNCKWAKKMLSNYTHARNDVALYNNDLFISGSFLNFIRFDGTTLRGAPESHRFDLFAAKYDVEGSFYWAARSEGTLKGWQAEASSIAVAGANRIYITGMAKESYIGGQPVSGPLFVARLTDGTNAITGSVFNDLNGNGLLDAGERPVPQTVIEVAPGPLYGITDAKGNYRVNVPPGSYTVKVSTMPKYNTAGMTTHQATFNGRGPTGRRESLRAGYSSQRN